MCFLIFFLYCYVTLIFAFQLNLAVHRLLKQSQSTCPALLPPSGTTVTPSLPPLPSHPSNLPLASVFLCVAMLEHMSRRSRSLLSLTLTTLALALSILALCTSYWCEGTHKVVKPLCLSPVKMKNCGQNNSEPYTTGTVVLLSPLNIETCILFLVSLLFQWLWLLFCCIFTLFKAHISIYANNMRLNALKKRFWLS